MKARRWWTVVAALVGILGVSSSIAAASAVSEDARDNGEERFERASAEVAANIQREVQHITDLMVNAQAIVRRTPGMTTSQMRAWADEVQLFDRYPALQTLSLTKIYVDSEYDDFVAQLTADPPENPTSTFAPPPRAPVYCVEAASVSRSAAVWRPAETNLCPGVSAELVSVMKSFDRMLVIPTPFEDKTIIAVAIPLYRTGTIPATPQEREAQFIAHLGVAIDPSGLLADAVADHPGLVAALDFRDPTAQLKEEYREGSISSVKLPDPAQKRVVELGAGWSVTVAGPTPEASMFRDSAGYIFHGGSLVSILLALLLYVLATGRTRALRLVATKTDELRHQALHDPLTGLANRTLLSDRAGQLLVRAQRTGSVPSCLFLDLDGFKNINDSLGHEAGDLLLREVSTRLQGTLRESDTLARMGGDEFVVLLDGAVGDDDATVVAERILEVLRQPFEVDGVESVMRITASVGIATGARATADDMIRDADLALYQAKAEGRNRVVVFRDDMQEQIQHGIELEFALRVALEREEFRLVYQPIYNLDDLSLVGFEALVRWEHPTLGQVQPNEFIPLLERTGQIVDVGRWVLEEACRQLAPWRKRVPTATMSVNVASQQFDTGLLVGQVRAALEAVDLPAAALTIEITESSLMRSMDVCVSQLVELRALGVKIDIDDFGTGYSSLSQLQQLPVDGLKIDRSFINAMGETPEARALVRTIVQLGRDLGLRTLAEGVETTEQMNDLRMDNIEQAQGFLLARPLDPAAVERSFLEGVPGVPSTPAMG